MNLASVMCQEVWSKAERDIWSALFQLFELLGFDRFEFIQLLLGNRQALVKNISMEAAREAILQAPSKGAQFLPQVYFLLKKPYQEVSFSYKLILSDFTHCFFLGVLLTAVSNL